MQSENLAEKFIMLDSLLFKLIKTLKKETAQLAVPEVCMDKSITLYHTSLFAGQQGVVKTYLTWISRSCLGHKGTKVHTMHHR